MGEVRQCRGRGARGRCRRRPPQGEELCGIHRDQGNVVRIGAGSAGSSGGRRSRPRSADALFVPAVNETLSSLSIVGSDAAIVRLARRYAAAIDASADEVDALATFGPKLRLALESLGATPAARARTMKGAVARDSGGGRLAGLRAARGSEG